MPQQLDIEKDPFLILLTDALRAGPGSPQWHEAVAQLRSSENRGVDEYKLLIEAREALESGKEYRTVRAGAGFTHKLMGGLDQQQQKKKTVHIASLVAAIAAFFLLVVVGVAIFELYPHTPIDDTRRMIDELASTYFPNELNSTTFENGIPPGWRKIGTLDLDVSGGLRPGSASVPTGDYIGGGIVLTDPLPPDKPAAFQVVIDAKHSSDDLIPQVFVSGDPNFSPDRGTSPRELVWQLQANSQKIVVNGRVVHQAGINLKSPTHKIRIIFKGDLAIVELDGRRTWSGRSELGNSPKFVGVRFIRTGEKTSADVTIPSAQVLTSNG